MKNFILIEAPATSEAAYLLYHLDPGVPDEAREFKPFTHYATWLARNGYAPATVENYSDHTGRFIDYVYEASKTQFPADVEVTIETIIYSYQAFLLFGEAASNPIARRLVDSLGKDKITGHNSLAQGIESSIRWFLQVSENKNKIAPDQLFSPFYTNRAEYRSLCEISAHKANSWVAAVIRDSLNAILPKRKNDTLFPQAKRRDRKNDKQPFKKIPYPIEYSVDLVRQAKPQKAKTFYRDMTLYALLAATGARSSEALQIRMPDIDDDDFAIFLRDPFARKTPGITEEEHKSLAWKGRATEVTYMIEPFARIFWDNLEKYLALEYNSSVGHDFLFQSSDGRPYFASDRSSRDKTFKNYAKKSGIANITGVSLHSLRHMYGTYTLNYMPVPGQATPGFPITYVKILMGHASVTSTMKYAKHDTDIIDAYLQHANQYVTQRGEDSIRTIREEFHIRQLEALRKEALRIEGNKHD
ncbi:tyrosine-type recombinase/integrase [Pseudomonas syringae]|uniref:tyrosine-type recombinase/integrase n=1 Tax=Pseudomonas syringae TaxID=317 RepID=UPI0018E62B88|nr:site-specific integrase [Pseudomonas syringae]MBI6770533.1 site-specific integrase [Pseudomonas syringae]MBI6774085.1 site-specific integrase [Pseudomonas syringae]MBI6790885.1 site-specific integrase [Pseudomonas syringae]MBI6803714.1 site-specific integrase [Pseudomonas syringae]